jgi:hypothetical protein
MSETTADASRYTHNNIIYMYDRFSQGAILSHYGIAYLWVAGGGDILQMEGSCKYIE